jgi:hypothetical protein
MSNEHETAAAIAVPESEQGRHGEHADHPHPVITTIIVNGQRKEVEGERLSFEQAVSLAYNGNPPQGPGWEFTVGYRRGPREKPDGSLTAGHSVKIVNEEVFNVTGTDKS